MSNKPFSVLSKPSNFCINKRPPVLPGSSNFTKIFCARIFLIASSRIKTVANGRYISPVWSQVTNNRFINCFGKRPQR